MPPDHNSSLTLALLALACGDHGDDERSRAGEAASASRPTTAATTETQATTTAPGATPATVVSGPPAIAQAATAAPATIAPPPATIQVGVAVVPATEATPTCSSAVEDDSNVRALLDSYAITNAPLLRERTLYSWTTAEQIAELRDDPTLLTRSADSNGEKGRAADLIHEQATTDVVAELLDRPEYANKRFAWVSPWATLLGWTGEDYGDRLLAMKLKPEAFIATLVGSSPLEWSFSTADGTPIGAEEVLANPHRLAAVYFIDPRDSGYCGGTIANAGSVFREFLVCNESMLESWSAFTPELQAELEQNQSALQAFQVTLTASRCQPWVEGPCHAAEVLQLWLSPRDELTTTLAYYFSALAFPNGLYEPTAATMGTLLDRLRAVPMNAEPLVHLYE